MENEDVEKTMKFQNKMRDKSCKKTEHVMEKGMERCKRDAAATKLE